MGLTRQVARAGRTTGSLRTPRRARGDQGGWHGLLVGASTAATYPRRLPAGAIRVPPQSLNPSGRLQGALRGHFQYQPQHATATFSVRRCVQRLALTISCRCGVESTVLDALRQPPAVLRPGGATYEQLRELPGLEGLQVRHGSGFMGVVRCCARLSRRCQWP